MKAIVISASSDIGAAACLRWLRAGWDVCGTFRTESPRIPELQRAGAKLMQCDLAVTDSVNRACTELAGVCPKWDVLVLAPGSQDPVGPFLECDFNEWETSIKVNMVSQLRIMQNLMAFRSTGGTLPTVLFFAGGGTNGAVLNYSAYTISKIALIKMSELLDAEIKDTKFAVIGPGWVRTKIHESTLKAERRAGANYQRTVSMFENGRWTPIEMVLDCCDWIISSTRDVVSGRNFSVVNDAWGTNKLDELLRVDGNMYKLRRNGNDVLMRSQEERAK